MSSNTTVCFMNCASDKSLLKATCKEVFGKQKKRPYRLDTMHPEWNEDAPKPIRGKKRMTHLNKDKQIKSKYSNTQCGDFDSVNSDHNCSWDLDEFAIGKMGKTGKKPKNKGYSGEDIGL